MSFILGLWAYDAGLLYAGVTYPGLAAHACFHELMLYQALTSSALERRVLARPFISPGFA